MSRHLLALRCRARSGGFAVPDIPWTSAWQPCPATGSLIVERFRARRVQGRLPPGPALEAQYHDDHLIIEHSRDSAAPRKDRDPLAPHVRAEIVREHFRDTVLEWFRPAVVHRDGDLVVCVTSDDLHPVEIAGNQHRTDADGDT